MPCSLYWRERIPARRPPRPDARLQTPDTRSHTWLAAASFSHRFGPTNTVPRIGGHKVRGMPVIRRFTCLIRARHAVFGHVDGGGDAPGTSEAVAAGRGAHKVPSQGKDPPSAGQTSPQGGDPSHQGDDHVVSPSPRFPSLLCLSSLLPPFLLSSSLPANPHGAQPGTRIVSPKRESAGSRGPLPKSCSPVWALDTLSPSLLPFFRYYYPGRGNAGPSASGGCTPKRYWPCICPRCVLITSQGFFGCAREKLPIARLWADANSPGQLHPKAGRGWWQVTFAPRRFRKKIQGKLRKSQVPLSYNINTAICYPLHIA